jgi:hypothetical protein
LFCKIGKTSLLYVTGALVAANAVIPIAKPATDASIVFILQASFGVPSLHAMISEARRKTQSGSDVDVVAVFETPTGFVAAI